MNINYNGQIIFGNNNQIILEQLEQAGIYIPSYCRSGVCEYCRVKLITGTVKILNKIAMQNDGTILCCSCIPQTSIHLVA